MGKSKFRLTDVTVANNSADKEGGIYADYSGGNLIFNSEQRCNIYSILGFRGKDSMYIGGSDRNIEVIVDAFAVLNPTSEYGSPIGKYTFDILHAVVTDITDESTNLPTIFALNHNYPNPFNPKTTIEFTLPKSKFVTLKIYHILGEEVETLVNDKLQADQYKYLFDGSKLANGVY